MTESQHAKALAPAEDAHPQPGRPPQEELPKGAQASTPGSRPGRIDPDRLHDLKLDHAHLVEWNELAQQDPQQTPLSAQQRQQLEELSRLLAEHQATLAAAWPELHETRDGGQVEPGGTVDLTPLWDRLWAVRANECNYAPDGTRTVDTLAEEAGGLAIRLAAGVQSLRQRRDGNVSVHIAADSTTLTVTVWSFGGCWTSRAWWARATWNVQEDKWGQLRLKPTGEAIMAVHGTGGKTVYHDSSGVLGQEIATWYRAREAREAIRSRIDTGCYLEQKTPLSLHEWCARLTA